MKFYVGVTDKSWFDQLKANNSSEVNFWKPGSSTFKALQPNDLFLFKLHAPYNYIVGGGFFVRFSLLPVFLAWQAFGKENGVKTVDELNRRIEKYRSRNSIGSNQQIGCIILTDVFYFDEQDWIPVPSDWSNSIVQGKTYDDSSETGKRLYDEVMYHFPLYSPRGEMITSRRQVEANQYGLYVTKHRLGQGAFRISVTEAYNRRCAVSGEKTLPVLQAAHIQPYSEDGPHQVNNGLLLRSDIHTLFDDGYITIDKDYRISVSNHLHDDYGNGKDYYKYHGQELLILPNEISSRPSKEFIEWHNDHVYRG